jgi:hypothetical protein
VPSRPCGKKGTYSYKQSKQQCKFTLPFSSMTLVYSYRSFVKLNREMPNKLIGQQCCPLTLGGSPVSRSSLQKSKSQSMLSRKNLNCLYRHNLGLSNSSINLYWTACAWCNKIRSHSREFVSGEKMECIPYLHADFFFTFLQHTDHSEALNPRISIQIRNPGSGRGGGGL